ncbi:MAG: flagellar hook-associated protein FlgK [Phycisphaerales bacterium]|jgi:flagellar hook-associated protein 1 FlgK
MDGFAIGVSGLHAAEQAFGIIGNNIANAATEGYHRQRVDLAPSYSSQIGSTIVGGGVEFIGVTRIIDGLLDMEISRQKSILEHVSQEVGTLRTIENAFGEFAEGNGLSAVIDDFFNALQDLSSHPTELVWQNQVVTSAQTMASRFRTLGEYLTTLKEQIELEAQNTIAQVNLLADKVAELNDNIEKLEIGGGKANNLRDQRDRTISEMHKLIGIETRSHGHGVTDVYLGGTPVVVGATVTELEVGKNENNELGISVADMNHFNITSQSGVLGGLLSLRNDIVSGIHDDLDSLATAIIQQINQYHVQGVGSSGSFTELTGWPVTSEDLVDFGANVTDGSIYIRVTNTSTGEITRSEIPIVKATDSLSSIATAISSITGLNGSVLSSKLHIQADANYEFDFLPAVLPEPVPTDINFSGSSDPSVSLSGIYTGSANDTLTFTVSGSGDVGIDTPLTLTVTDGAANTIDIINIGSGYAVGDKIDIGNTGIKLSLGTGDLNAGDSFSIDVFADTDTSGVLAAVGMNTFLAGSSASDMTVCSDITDTPGRVASSLGADMTDNTNASRMAGLKEQAVTSLNSLTPVEFYHQMITGVGQDLLVKQTRRDNLEAMIQNLTNQQSEISGVDINDEATQILLFEQMFKAMSKYLSTLQSSLATVMEII